MTFEQIPSLLEGIKHDDVDYFLDRYEQIVKERRSAPHNLVAHFEMVKETLVRQVKFFFEQNTFLKLSYFVSAKVAALDIGYTIDEVIDVVVMKGASAKDIHSKIVSAIHESLDDSTHIIQNYSITLLAQQNL